MEGWMAINSIVLMLYRIDGWEGVPGEDHSWVFTDFLKHECDCSIIDSPEIQILRIQANPSL
jgi:hypothetical protein